MKIKAIFLLIVFFIIIVFFIEKGNREVKYDNEKKYSELTSQYYSAEELLSIHNQIINGDSIKLNEIFKKQDIKCARNIGDIRYLLLAAESGEKLFIYFDDEKVIKKSYLIKNILEQKDFENVQIGQTRLSEIIELDENIFDVPISSLEATVHLVKEGVIIITYNRLQDTTVIADPIVESTKFYENDDILEQREQDILLKVAPYILPVDK